MSEPNPVLMRTYDTEQVYREKLAKKLPVAAGVAAAILGTLAFRSVLGEQESEAREMNEQFSSMERARNAGMHASLMGRPIATSPEADLSRRVHDAQEYGEKVSSPMAVAVANECGHMLAKKAGIIGAMGAARKAGKGLGGALKAGVGELPLIGRKGATLGQKALLVGGAGLGAYGLYRGASGAAQLLNQPAQATGRRGEHRPRLPRYVNQWGQPVG